MVVSAQTGVRRALAAAAAVLATATLTGGATARSATAGGATAGAATAGAATTRSATAGGATSAGPAPGGLAGPREKEIAMELVCSAENSSLDWRAQYGYIQDIHDGRGYTGGLVGFTSATGDMLEVVTRYTRLRRVNPLTPFLPALRAVNGSASHKGLGPAFVKAWKRAARDPRFQRAQRMERDQVYFEPAVALARSDGLRALGQFAYYDAAVVHGMNGLRAIRRRALRREPTPARGGDEVRYLNVFLDERDVEMRKEAAHSDLSRIEDEQRRFLRAGNLDLRPPLRWSTYGDHYAILH